MALVLIALGSWLEISDYADRIFKRLDRVVGPTMQDWPILLQMTLPAVLACFILLLLIECIMGLFGFLDTAIHNWLARIAQARTSQLGISLLDAPPILSIVLKGDEARRYLWGLSAIAEIPNVIKAILGVFISAWLFLACLLLGAVMRELFPESQHLGDLFVFVLFYGALFLFILLLLMPLIVVITSVLVRAHPLAFGEKILDNLVLRTEVTKTPSKVSPPADLVELEPSESLRVQGGLRHSLIYEDPQVVKVIADWLRGKHVIGTERAG
jgi:hypothetical protein